MALRVREEKLWFRSSKNGDKSKYSFFDYKCFMPDLSPLAASSISAAILAACLLSA